MYCITQLNVFLESVGGDTRFPMADRFGMKEKVAKVTGAT
jgi:hypothetical protein